jgi:hypothetical protein
MCILMKFQKKTQKKSFCRFFFYKYKKFWKLFLKMKIIFFWWCGFFACRFKNRFRKSNKNFHTHTQFFIFVICGCLWLNFWFCKKKNQKKIKKKLSEGEFQPKIHFFIFFKKSVKKRKRLQTHSYFFVFHV